MSSILEVLQEGVSHTGSTPLVLLVNERHGGRGAQASNAVGYLQMAVEIGCCPVVEF